MPQFPPLAHVAVTVTDLDRSTQWYTALFGSEPVLDEDDGIGAFHHTVYACRAGNCSDCTPTPSRPVKRSTSAAPVSTTWPSRAVAATNCSSGQIA